MSGLPVVLSMPGLNQSVVQCGIVDIISGLDGTRHDFVPELVTAESSLVDDIGLDSLDVVEFLLGLEEKFGVTISDDEAEKVFTVGDAMALVLPPVQA